MMSYDAGKYAAAATDDHVTAVVADGALNNSVRSRRRHSPPTPVSNGCVAAPVGASAGQFGLHRVTNGDVTTAVRSAVVESTPIVVNHGGLSRSMKLHLDTAVTSSSRPNTGTTSSSADPWSPRPLHDDLVLSPDSVSGSQPASTVSSPADGGTPVSAGGRYRLVSLADEYFPVTLGAAAAAGRCNGDVLDSSMRSSRTGSGSGSVQSSAGSRTFGGSGGGGGSSMLNGHRRPHHHHHRHHRHHHRQDDSGQQTQRPGSGQSSSSSNSRSSVDRIYVSALSASDGLINGGSTVLTPSPFRTELTRLQMERLRIEEARFKQLQVIKHAEEQRGPIHRWYELKSPQFHYEAHKNNRQVGVNDVTSTCYGGGSVVSGGSTSCRLVSSRSSQQDLL